jgi:hypothetical protein
MSIILSKSPYIVEVGGTSVIGGKVEVFIWKQGSAIPTSPQYTLSKLSPASNVNTVYFDVAPYVNEFITNKLYTVNSTTTLLALPIENYCNVKIIAYKLVGSTYTSISLSQSHGLKGYSYQTDGINVSYNYFLLDEKTYYYHYDSAKTYDTLPAGDLTFYINEDYISIKFKYTNLVSGSITNVTSTSFGTWKKIARVLPSYWSSGNKLEIFDDGDVLLATYYFKPISECRYSPVTLDFINKYGAWQREFMFKNSTDFINTESKSYKNFRAVPTTFNAQESLVTTFNSNGNETIKCNTGFVEEDFKGTIKQLLLSDRILINNRPATITTNQIELQKNINNKLINYALDFTFSNPII